MGQTLLASLKVRPGHLPGTLLIYPTFTRPPAVPPNSSNEEYPIVKYVRSLTRDLQFGLDVELQIPCVAFHEYLRISWSFRCVFNSKFYE